MNFDPIIVPLSGGSMIQWFVMWNIAEEVDEISRCGRYHIPTSSVHSVVVLV